MQSPIPCESTLVEATATSRAEQALRLVEATLPHLCGLSRQVRLVTTNRVPVAAVAASGLTAINAAVFRTIAIPDAMYILAHELMHLALDTHARAGNSDRLTVNIAHDLIINDMLSEELHRAPPLGGLFRYRASERSLEEWIVQLHQSGTDGWYCWNGDDMPEPASSRSTLSKALEDAGVFQPVELPQSEPPLPSTIRGDLISSDEEKELEPEISPFQRQALTLLTRRTAVRTASLAELRKGIERAVASPTGSTCEAKSQNVEAIRNAYRTPWQRVLQQWIDAISPSQRDYARASRRVGTRRDIVLPGRCRHGWTMHIVLDSSGSMTDELPAALGAISSFCLASGVSEVHVIQCDSHVTSDRWIDVDELARFEISGYGGSDLSFALDQLSLDPEVTGALVLTDGCIHYPRTAPRYEVMWALVGRHRDRFNPPYGIVVPIDSEQAT
ncbi:MAG: hypothetical protein KDB27_22405 [Planctomycetales bacterium]|nr:hypothetical protein [Planctomycetales bacterium]